MSKKKLPSIQRKTSVSFDIDNNETLISDPLPPIIYKTEKFDDKELNVHVAVQTDPQWLDQLKKDILASLEIDLDCQEKLSTALKSKTSTVRTKKSKVSSLRSKIKHDPSVREDTELLSEHSMDSAVTIPAYPENKMDDEFGIALFNSSDDDDENFEPERIAEVIDNHSELNMEMESKYGDQEKIPKMIPDAGLPTIFKVSKELCATDLSPPISADAFLLNALSPKDGEVCDFCNKPLVAMPTVKDQVSNSVDQAQLFCCQEYRELVDFALAQKTSTNNQDDSNEQQTKLIDITPHKSAKSPDELAELKAKSEKKIRDRLLARQQAALVAAQTAKIRAEVPRRAHTEILSLTARQMRIINYQLSSYKFIEDGWTVSPKVLSNFEMVANRELTEEVINMDYTTSIFDLFGQANLSEKCSTSGVTRQYYPDGKLFLILFKDGKANIYYPSGNLAISIIRPSEDSSVICIIKKDSPTIDSQSKVLAVVNTNGFGSFSFADESQRIVFNTLLGVELHQDGTKRRQWFWSGEPHVHAPPFQPVCFSINRHIGVRISSQNAIYINFLGFSKQIHINVGCKIEIPVKIRNKMHNMVKIETQKLQAPLIDLKNKARTFIEKCYEALDHPFLVTKNKWPVKSLILSKTASENRTTMSLSLA